MNADNRQSPMGKLPYRQTLLGQPGMENEPVMASNFNGYHGIAEVKVELLKSFCSILIQEIVLVKLKELVLFESILCSIRGTNPMSSFCDINANVMHGGVQLF